MRLFERLPDILCIAASDGYFRDVNPAFGQLLGYGREELTSRPFLEFVLPEDRERTRRHLEERFQGGGASRLVNRYLRADGRVVVLAWQGRLDPERQVIYCAAIDITEHDWLLPWLAPVAPNDRSLEFERIFSMSAHPMAVADFDGFLQKANPAFLKLLGYDEGEISSQPFVEFVHPEDRERSLARYEQVKAEVGPTSGVFVNRYRGKDGVSHRFAWRGVVLPAERRIYSIGEDITDLEWVKPWSQDGAAPAATAVTDEELVPFFSLSLDLLAIADMEGKFTRLNPAFERVLGYAMDELVGKPYLDLVHPEDREATVAASAALQRGEEVVRFENRYRAKDGSYRTLLWQSAPSVERGLVYGVAHDITERQQMRDVLEQHSHALESLVHKRTETLERAIGTLRGERERYAVLVENSLLGIVVHRDEKILFANKRFAEMFGFAGAKDVLAMGSLDPLFRKDDYGRLKEYRSAVARGEPHPPFFQVQGVRKDGKPVWVDKITAVIEWEGAPALQATYLDITETKSLQEQLQHAMRMESIGRLAGGIAHDFNNMLSVIVSYSGLLVDNFAENDPARQDIEEMRHAAERAVALTRQLLAFSRRQVQHLEILDVNQVVKDTDKMLRRLIGEDINLIIEPHPRLGAVKADVSQIEQVIMNLVVNARDAMPQGGSLTVETANVSFDETYANQHLEIAPGDYVMLAVSDTGTGMDEETRAHIFEPFFTTKEKGKGTGLGLATVYGIVTQSGGGIHLYSELGKGTTFKIYLPRVTAGDAESERVEPELADLAGTETVLLVEDEAQVRKAARRILERSGYTILEARNGPEALQLSELYSGTIQLLLTDVVMPQMGGREVAERLLQARPGLRVVFMSGYTDDAVLNHGVLEGDVLFVQKPFAAGALLQRARQALDAD